MSIVTRAAVALSLASDHANFTDECSTWSIQPVDMAHASYQGAYLQAGDSRFDLYYDTDCSTWNLTHTNTDSGESDMLASRRDINDASLGIWAREQVNMAR